MSEEDTIKIKKSSIWKYTTILLLVVVIVGGFIAFTGKSVSQNTANTGSNNGNTAAADVSVFTKNPDLFPSLGPDNAQHTVIEFADFQCPYCALASGFPSWTSQYASQYSDLIGAAGKAEDLAKQGQIKFVYVPMSFLGQESVYAAQAAYCAENQGKFWEMHDAIFAASDGPSEETGKYSIANLKIIAQGISGLDTSKFNNCLDNNDTLQAVQQAASYASQAVSGTPAFFVDGKQVSASWSAISAAIGA